MRSSGGELREAAEECRPGLGGMLGDTPGVNTSRTNLYTSNTDLYSMSCRVKGVFSQVIDVLQQ